MTVIINAVFKFDFEVLIDESFAKVATDNKLAPLENKKILSLINDFEDGEWRYKKFQKFLWDNIAETALSHKERQCLVNKSQTELIESAKKLRLTDLESEDIGKGSEIAEILLYGIMKHHYQALPVVPKIFYKQNNKDQAKGADSVHVVLESDNDFSLWLGESKFYNSIEDARLGAIVNSVAEILETDKLKKKIASSLVLTISYRLCRTLYDEQRLRRPLPIKCPSII